jgi:hypothetical protein
MTSSRKRRGLRSVAWLIVFLGLTPHSRITAAQTNGRVPEYAALVDQYRRGEFQPAVAAMAQWPRDRVRAATSVPGFFQDTAIARGKAAAMLHADVAMLLAETDRALSGTHLEAARAAVQVLPDATSRRFKERWQAYAVGPSLVQHEFTFAKEAIRRGLGAYPGSADLQMMDGVLFELAARSGTADFRGNWIARESSGARGRSIVLARIEDNLVSAATAYRRALEIDRDLVTARLRLGWVYDVNNSRSRGR